jgi:hypothetical protein
MKFCRKGPILYITLNILAVAIGLSCRNATGPHDNSTDTTSHNFSWTVETLGETGSTLYDVAIINDSLAYAVGQIYLKDSTGQVSPYPYCMAVWDGTLWRFKRKYYYDLQTLRLVTAIPQEILALSSTDVWLATGSIFHWNGKDSVMDLSFNRLALSDPNGTVTALWGTSSADLYGVGNVGTVVHYDGRYWTQLQSVTTLPINDISGAQNSSGQWEILAVASNDQDRRLLQIQGTIVSILPDSGLSNTLFGVWFVPGVHYYVVGTGIHYKNRLDEPVWNRYPSGVVTSYASGGIRGNGANDVFVVGSFFEVVHYNGSTWYNYQKEIPLTNGAFGRVAVKGDLVIAVGLEGQQAAVLIGRR